MIVYPICSGLFIPWVLGKLGAREALKIENQVRSGNRPDRGGGGIRRNLILIWKLKLSGPNFKMTSMEKKLCGRTPQKHNIIFGSWKSHKLNLCLGDVEVGHDNSECRDMAIRFIICRAMVTITLWHFGLVIETWRSQICEEIMPT